MSKEGQLEGWREQMGSLNGNLQFGRFIICSDLENANYQKNISLSEAKRQEALLR